MNRRLLLLAGPTAVGKSAVALHLATQRGGEIVSVDSMQVYRGLDIGTAKPSAADRRRVPHHLVDIVDIADSFDAAQFVERAEAAMDDIRRRGRLPILCGGTGLYFKALLEGLGSAPAGTPALRRELESTPLPRLLEELAAADPETYARIDRANPRRVIRAVEILRLTGAAGERLRAPWSRPSAGGPQPGFFALERSREDLAGRIDRRVEAMFRDGLVDETRELMGRGLERNRTALQAIGYRQVVEHLRGARGLPETVRLVQQRTRQFARRQHNWLRRHLPVTWVACGPDERPQDVAERVAAAWATVVKGAPRAED